METRDIQLALGIFGAGVPDGLSGKNTTRAIKLFQEHAMGDTNPDGIMGSLTEAAIHTAWEEYSPEHKDICCKCGQCSGYGNGLYEGKYRVGKPECEAYYNYEYDGISEMTVWAAVMVQAVFRSQDFKYSSGYRCWNDNKAHSRSSTNHMGKAIDLRPDYGDPTTRAAIADSVRSKFHEMGGVQIGWNRTNMLSFEPGSIAPTWIHIDARCFGRRWIESTLIKI